MADYPKEGQKGKLLQPAGGNFTSKGHTGHMYPWLGSGEQQPGQSAEQGRGARRDQVAKGGAAGVASEDDRKSGKGDSKHGHNRDYAGTQEAGTSSPTKSGGDKNGFAKGGTTPMFGNHGSMRAEGGKTSAC